MFLKLESYFKIIPLGLRRWFEGVTLTESLFCRIREDWGVACFFGELRLTLGPHVLYWIDLIGSTRKGRCWECHPLVRKRPVEV